MHINNIGNGKEPIQGLNINNSDIRTEEKSGPGDLVDRNFDQDKILIINEKADVVKAGEGQQEKVQEKDITRGDFTGDPTIDNDRGGISRSSLRHNFKSFFKWLFPLHRGPGGALCTYDVHGVELAVPKHRKITEIVKGVLKPLLLVPMIPVTALALVAGAPLLPALVAGAFVDAGVLGLVCTGILVGTLATKIMEFPKYLGDLGKGGPKNGVSSNGEEIIFIKQLGGANYPQACRNWKNAGVFREICWGFGR